ncbi:hypothetical protein J7J83_04185 [bacterium]|nr:hypothetical protein [bacterium]
MADEENKKVDIKSQPVKKNNNTQNTGSVSGVKKKKRYRPKKRSNSKKIEDVSVKVPKSDNNKNRTRHRPKKRNHNSHKSEKKFTLGTPKVNNSVDNKTEIGETPELEIEDLNKDVNANLIEQAGYKPESINDEGGFNLSKIEENETPAIEEKNPDLEEETLETEEEKPDLEEKTLEIEEEKPDLEEETPVIEEKNPDLEEETLETEDEDLSTGDKVQAPVETSATWNQLKESIKKDHKETEQKIKPESNQDVPSEVAPATVVGVNATDSDNTGEDKSNQKDSENGDVIPPATLSEDELERKEVIQIITRYVLVGCLIIVIISTFFFFKLPQRAFEGITGLFSGDETKTEEVAKNNETQGDTTKELESTFVAGKNGGTSRDKFEKGVATALISGESGRVYEGVNPSIKSLYLIGLKTGSVTNTDRIASYMDVLLRLQNAFSTDIHQLLDNSRDRGKALNLHLTELRDVYQESIDTQRDVNENKDKLKVEFNEVTTQKNKVEKDFFVSLDRLEGNKSNNLLNSFIETSKRQIDLKAGYNALNKISELFDIALKNMDARIKDIEFNKKALIQGVQVVDIKGSDLDLIIQEEK